MTKAMTVGQRVQWARKRANLTQDQLAAQIQTTRQVVIGWEKDRHMPTLYSRRRIADATGQQEELFRDETDEEEDELLAALREAHPKSLADALYTAVVEKVAQIAGEIK